MKNGTKIQQIFCLTNKILKIMVKILSHRFIIRKNGNSINSYLTLGRALISLEQMYKNGKVNPYDTISIFDRQTMSFVLTNYLSKSKSK